MVESSKEKFPFYVYKIQNLLLLNLRELLSKTSARE